MDDTWGFVTWEDVTSDHIEGEKATFYFIPSRLEPGWYGNGRRLEVKWFQAGRVAGPRGDRVSVFVEFIARGRRKKFGRVERSRPSLVIVKGWHHPDPPSALVKESEATYAGRYATFAKEWRTEMDAFLERYLAENPSVEVLADFRDGSAELVDDGGADANASGNTAAGGSFAIDDHLVNGPSGSEPLATTPDETGSGTVLTEGTARSVLLNEYERSPEARRECIEHYGAACFVCGFNFARTYGDALHGYIHVHHLKPLSEIGSEYVVDPVADLRPVCPNCHAVVHSREPQYTLDEVRHMIRRFRNA